MKKQTITVFVALLFIFSCNPNQEQISPVSIALKEVEAYGYVVPKDSIAKPKMTTARKPFVVSAGKPTVVRTASNVYPVGKPKIISAGVLSVHTPGRDSFSLPKTFPVTAQTILAGSPEVIMAKDAMAKDQNLYNFSSFGPIQGLINSQVISLLEDKKGNLWIGTYGGGVCRYDGISFTHFTEKEGLAGNVVTSILEDKSENLWFGTLGGGVCKYDGKFFTRFTEKEGLGSNFVNSMIEDRSGNLWIGTAEGGVTKYVPADNTEMEGNTQETHKSSTGSFTRFTIKEGLCSNFIWTIYEDKKGNIWFGSGGDGACSYDGKSFTLFTGDKIFGLFVVKAIREDNRGNFWFATWGQGVFKYDGTNFNQYTVREGLNHNNVRTILGDKNGTFWFGTEGGGICLYDPGDSTFTHFTVREGLSNDLVNAIIKDKNGIVWIGTNYNLNKYLGKSITHFTEKVGVNGTIKCVIEAKNGKIWFGGNTGLRMYDGKNITHFTEKEGLLQDNVNTILEDKNGNLWIGSYAGVTKYDGKSFTHFSGGDVQSIKEDKNGNLWFGTYGRGVVSNYDGKSFTFLTRNEGIGSNWIWTMLEDKKGNFWFGTADRGVSKYTPFGSNAGFTHFFEKGNDSKKNMRAIVEDKKGDIWFGSYGGGVLSYNSSADTSKLPGQHAEKTIFTNYTKEVGLISDFVEGILEDKNNILWVSTSDGVSKIDKNYLQKTANQKINTNNQSNSYHSPILFKNINYTDGFHGTAAFRNAICEDKNGTIWIGTIDRLTAFHTGEDMPDTIPPNLQLTGLALFNEYISWQFLERKRDSTIVLGNGERIHDYRFKEVNHWYGCPQQLSLAYDNNHLSFRFVGITTHSPKKVKYQYMLVGLDKNWSALADRTEVSYNNLSHGSYTFKVKAMNSEGSWSKELNYPFGIRPPWWLSGWAYSFYGLCLIAGIFFTDRLQRRRVLQKERAISRERELEQAKEIEKAYHKLEQSHENLKATQAQLIQSEKMASLGELTAGIAHEIQNPLNFVNNFSEVNAELIEELKGERQKAESERNVQLEDDILNDLSNNLEKINHHGKRADAIVKGMLLHSRSSTGLKEPTDINNLADEYLRLSYHGLRAKDKSFNATIKTDFDERIGKVNIIQQDIGRVLLNLFNNAFYAVNEKKQKAQEYEATVLITTKKIGDKPNSYRVEIKVADNGNGIPQKILDKIFQPFFTSKPTGQGTGLGLSMSYDIVKAHGGQLKVETREGEGSEFIIQLPID